MPLITEGPIWKNVAGSRRKSIENAGLLGDFSPGQDGHPPEIRVNMGFIGC